MYIPRWGLVDHIAPTPVAAETAARKGPSVVAVHAALLSAVTVLGLAALVHIVRYVLLLINRTALLPSLLATAELLLGALVSLAAIVAVILAAAVLTSWLIARRSAVFAHLGQDDPRPVWSLWVGCMVPVVNLVWAPVFVIELAHAEDSQARLRHPIAAWWVTWVFSTAISIFASATSFTTEAQGVADNTVAVIIAYLAGMAAVLLLWRVFDAFVRKPVERPLHHWVIVATDRSDAGDTETPSAVEREPQEPAPLGV